MTSSVKSAKTALIAVEGCNYSFDKLFSYAIPDECVSIAEIGIRVLIPFGRSDSLRQGMILDIIDTEENNDAKLKMIHSILDAKPLLNKEMVSLVYFLHERCFCSYFSCVKAVLPGGMCLKTEKIYSVEKDIHPDKLSELDITEKNIVSFIASRKKAVKESLLKKHFPQDEKLNVVKKLVKKDLLNESAMAFAAVRDLTQQMIRLSDESEILIDEIMLTEKQKNVVELFSEGDEYSIKEICYYTGCGESVVKKLIEKKILCSVFNKVSRSPVIVSESEIEAPKIVLSEQQKKVYNKLLELYKNNCSETALLHGITGSGKTNTYLELIDRVLEDDKSVIVLVPEISLTPQTFSIFMKRYGNRIAILHSGLSMGERHDEWHRINSGKAKVVIGTRSAIFAPLKNIGLIIIDEEQEHTYKSENAPRYNAKDVAKYRCAYNNALLVLVSATPSIETYAKAKNGKYFLTELTERYGTAVLPDVKIIDMTDKTLIQPFMSLSMPLANEIEENLKKKEQSILLVNRRGYNTFVVCSDCKEVMTCPKCSISLTYHNDNKRLMCHYCGYSVPYVEKCPSCGAENIKYSGSGTQKIQHELEIRFPDAKILRMDADTTLGKNAHDKILSSFGSGEYDILIGTQMVAKGLDFSNVTLVGIVSADNELYNTDFRCSEKTFDLITQVIGRAGRGEKKGRAVIQTLTPDNNTINIAAVQDYKTFYNGEIALRKAMIYPPFCDIVEVAFSGKEKERTTECAESFLNLLKRKNEDESIELKLIVLGPLAPRVSKINNYYRSRLIIKCRNNKVLRSCISDILINISKDNAYKDINIYADLNPENIN